MNILILTNSLLKGGAEKQSLFLAQILKKNHNICVIVFHKLADEDYTAFLKRNNIKFEILPKNLIKKIIRFLQILKEQKINLIFAYLPVNNIFAAVLGKMKKIPFIIGGYRGSIYKSKIKFLLQKYVHNNINYSTIVNNYEGEKLLIANGFDESKLMVIHNGIESKPNNHFRKVKSNVIRIISVGRFHESKDYLTALKAVKHLSKYIEVSYSIVGYGELQKQVEKFIVQQELSKIVKIIVNPLNLFDYYKNSDIYLSTSIYEGCSNTIMEAMSNSLPVVATNVGDNYYLVKENINGFLCKPGDWEKLANCLLHLSNSEIMRDEFGKQSFQIISNEFSLEKMEEKYNSIIDNITYQGGNV